MEEIKTKKNENVLSARVRFDYKTPMSPCQNQKILALLLTEDEISYLVLCTTHESAK